MNKDFQIIQGDALAVLKGMESESVQMCVTSPPYFGLRNYGATGQIGLESTPAEFVAAIVTVFNEVRRVLKSDGTCWLNLGDSYAGSGRGLNADGTHSADGTNAKQATNQGAIDAGRAVNDKSFPKSLIENGSIGNAWVKPPAGFKPKDLIGIPWRVAFALQEAGWWLRQDIIWSKPNPMPESVTDRCTKSHEYIFLLTKSAKYYYNAEAIRTPLHLCPDTRLQSGKEWQPKGRDTSNGNRNGKGASTLDIPRHKNLEIDGQKVHTLHADRANGDEWQAENGTANKKSVWTVTTQPFKAAHFATFPEKLIEPCILAGSREGDIVLDPFSGAGTSGLVSLKHRRRYIGIELNPDYIAITEKRLAEIQVKLF